MFHETSFNCIAREVSMGFFLELLRNRGLKNHDGRPLWQYDLSYEEYQKLKNYLHNLPRFDKTYDARDLTLFYAEWWKNEYSTGSPSKELVFQSIGRNRIGDAEIFFKHAVLGAQRLGIRWLSQINTLYFRTLLLQGGVPINHLIKHSQSGNYTRFLKKVMELQPQTIADFVYDYDLISILPRSSRNNEIYECCLQIVRAVLDGDEKYLSIFEKDETLKSISKDLREYKQAIQNRIVQRLRFRSHWILKNDNGNYKIFLRIDAPNQITEAELKSLLSLKNDQGEYAEYRLFVDDILFIRYVRNLDNQYLAERKNGNEFTYHPDSGTPDIYVKNTFGDRYELKIIKIPSPDLHTPTLWSEITEQEWRLCNGSRCHDSNAIILHDNAWKSVDSEISKSQITINGNLLNKTGFANTITLKKGTKKIVFENNKSALSWQIIEGPSDKIDWILKANVPVVRSKPNILIFDENEQQVDDFVLEWRSLGNTVWNSWDAGSIDIGYIDFKIIAGDIEEFGALYNLGTFDLKYPRDATVIRAEGNPDLVISFAQDPGPQTLNGLRYDFTGLELNTTSLKAFIQKRGQQRKLIVEILPPLLGIHLYDHLGNLVPAESRVVIHDIKGYRILTRFPENKNPFIRIFNNEKQDVIYTLEIKKSGMIALQDYQEIIIRLLQLTGGSSIDSCVKIEFYQYDGLLLFYFYVMNFNKSLEWGGGFEVVPHEVDDDRINVFALRVDPACELEKVEPIPLEFENGRHNLNEDIMQHDSILFADPDYEHGFLLLPKPIPGMEVVRSRFEIPADALPDSMIWMKVLAYFKIATGHNLSFSIFNILKILASSPILAAKFYCLINMHIVEDVKMYLNNYENDLGISFHWIPIKVWEEAMQWALSKTKDIAKEQTQKLLTERVIRLYIELEPYSVFSKISDYHFMLDKAALNNMLPEFLLNIEMDRMRCVLGERVLAQIPSQSPKIGDENHWIMPVNDNLVPVKLLLKTPVAIGLSITGKDCRIWHSDEQIKRNAQYAQWIAPEWYGKSLLYSIQKLLSCN